MEKGKRTHGANIRPVVPLTTERRELLHYVLDELKGRAQDSIPDAIKDGKARVHIMAAIDHIHMTAGNFLEKRKRSTNATDLLILSGKCSKEVNGILNIEEKVWKRHTKHKMEKNSFRLLEACIAMRVAAATNDIDLLDGHLASTEIADRLFAEAEHLTQERLNRRYAG
jgi:hypothetical protein